MRVFPLIRIKWKLFFFSTVAVFEPRLIFDNRELVFVNNHKHLGLTFSSDCKWHTHIDILASVSRMLGILRNLKFRLGRKALYQIYLSYLRPLLEYATVVWDGCTLHEKRKMEQVQYVVARLVTGLTRPVSIENLIKEIEWLSLSDRRLFQKVLTLLKIKKRICAGLLA